MRVIITDGGRGAAGYATRPAGDCVARAIAIATEQPYGQTYKALANMSAELGGRRSARDGVPKKIYSRYLDQLGWVWTPTMFIGQGTKVHMRADELPSGRLICRLSGHLAAVVDGVVHDAYDPTRGGTRCVYGYWQPQRPRTSRMSPRQPEHPSATSR